MTQEKQRPRPPAGKVLGIALLVLLWMGLTTAGFWQAKEYVERKVREIQETNALNVQALEEQIQSLRTEMNDIEEALAKTDKTLSSTGSASEEVNKRITELDEQLRNLEKSLNILKESGNADY